MTGSKTSADEATMAVNLALVLDDMRYGLTFDQIVDSGVLGDASLSADTLGKRFRRARERLGDCGIVIRQTGAGLTDGPRYLLDPTLSFAQTDELALTHDEVMTLASLLAYCVGGEFPFKADLLKACRRILDIAGHTEQIAIHADEASADPVVQAASDALAQRRPLRFKYLDAHGNTSDRVVEPYAVRTRRGMTYLVGRDQARSTVRVFRMDRVQPSPKPRVLEADGPYAIPADFDPSEFFMLPFQYGEDELFEAIFTAVEDIDEYEDGRLTEGHGTWEPAGSRGHAAGSVWTISARDLSGLACWSAASEHSLTPVEPACLVDTLREGLSKVVDIHA